MSNNQIKKFLEVHNVDFYEAGPRIYAVTYYTDLRTGEPGQDIEDVTGYDLEMLKSYMNY